MLEAYVYHGTQKLRCGYTTGSCAAAASKAATQMLLTHATVKQVTLDTPKGIPLTLDVLFPEPGTAHASCAIQKDSGDDPDITNGILVYARAEKTEGYHVEICGGTGIGTVTKAGLDQPIGAAAINHVPRAMIRTAVLEICEQYDYTGGIRITISIPNGEELAKKTFNPRIGIVNGISILGTTGIVEPMSSKAWIETIRIEIRMQRQARRKYLLLIIGNYGKHYLEEEFSGQPIEGVMCSNFIGEAIEAALEFGMEGVLIVGHIGKLVKLGAGIMNTHSAQADGRMEVLVTCGVLAGADLQTLQQLPDCATVDAALEKLYAIGMADKTAEILMQRTDHALHAKVKDAIAIGAVMFSERYGLIGKTSQADNLMKQILEEQHG